MNEIKLLEKQIKENFNECETEELLKNILKMKNIFILRKINRQGEC